MIPEREGDSLVELLDRLLNKGLVLNADVLISVGGIPLIGLSLRLLAAGIETMLEYGLFEQFDKNTRDWELKHRINKPALMSEEEVILRSYGSYSHNQSKIWNYCFIYLTNRRVFGWNKSFNKILYQISLKDILEVTVVTNVYEEKEREELCIKTNDGSFFYVHSQNISEVHCKLTEKVYCI